MSEQVRLERSYRRLLRTYPRFYRRHRGVEILTTMMEAARPGQERASRSEAIHLLLSGLRYRFVPPGWFGKVTAAAVTLWAAVVLGGAGAYLAWQFHQAREPIGDPAFVDTLVGKTPSTVVLSSSDPLEIAYSHKSSGELQWLGSEGLTGAKPVPDGQIRIYREVGSAEAILTAARERLRGEGWQTGAVTRMDWCTCELFWASHDGQLLRLADGDNDSAIFVSAFREEPSGVREAAVAGFAAGILLIWPMMTLQAHLVARAPRIVRMSAAPFGIAVIVAAVANTVDNVLSMVPDPHIDSVLLAADFMYPLANQVNNPMAVVVIGFGLAVITVIGRRAGRQQLPAVGWQSTAYHGE